MLYRADIASQLAKLKDELETKAQQDETDLKAKKSALLDVIQKYVCFTPVLYWLTVLCMSFFN